MKKVILVSLCAISMFSHLHAILVLADPHATAGETFSFSIGHAKFDAGTDTSAPVLWVTTAEPIENEESKPYGLSIIPQYASYIGTLQPTAIPLAVAKKAKVYSFDGKNFDIQETNNPIIGSAFHAFDVEKQKPVFVLSHQKNKLYALVDIKALLTQDNEKNPEFLAYDFATTDVIDKILTFSDFIFVLYHNDQNVYKLALLCKTSSSLINAKSKDKSNITIPHLKLQADTIIDSTLKSLCGNTHPCANLGKNITMNYMSNSVCLGLDLTASSNPDSKASALVSATLNNGNFEFNNLIPDKILQAIDFSTPISTTAGQQICISHIAYMATSTSLNYLLVASNHGETTTSLTKIYALPFLPSSRNYQGNSVIADCNNSSKTYTSSGTLFSQNFSNAIMDPEQININGQYTQQLLVGGGDLPLDAGSKVQQLYAVGDSVYAVIANNYSATQAPGTFTSQAIFGPQGHIIGWTPWSRALGTDQQTLFSYVDRTTASGFKICAKDFSDTPSFKSVYQTTFTSNTSTSGSINFDPLIQAFAHGIQTLSYHPNLTLAPQANRVNALLATENNKLTIFAYAHNFASQNILTITDPAHQTITSTEIVQNSHDNITDVWLLYASSAGLSAYVNPESGITWSSTQEIDNQQPVKIGNFSNIKKIVADESNLYVMTNKELYCININAEVCKNPTSCVDVQPIAIASQLGSATTNLLDILVDNGFCLIATNQGLFSANIKHQKIMHFENIQLPEGSNNIAQLIIISSESNAYKKFKTLSNLYVLSSSFKTQQSTLTRLVIDHEQVIPMTTSTLKTCKELSITKEFVKFDNFVRHYFTNGSWNLACSFPQINKKNGEVTITPPVLQLYAGINTTQLSSHVILVNLAKYAPLNFLHPQTTFINFLQEPVTGAVWCTGNFTTHVNM